MPSAHDRTFWARPEPEAPRIPSRQVGARVEARHEFRSAVVPGPERGERPEIDSTSLYGGGQPPPRLPDLYGRRLIRGHSGEPLPGGKQVVYAVLTTVLSIQPV